MTRCTGAGQTFRPDADGHSTTAAGVLAQDRGRAGGRFPGSAPWHDGGVSRQNTPPSRSSGRPGASPSDPRRPGSPGSDPTEAQPARARHDARTAAPTRSGSPPARSGPCSGRGSRQDPSLLPKRPDTAGWPLSVKPGEAAPETGNLSRAHHLVRLPRATSWTFPAACART